MQKIKISSFILASLIIVFSICLTVAIAKAEDTNEANTNERQINTNETRDINEDINKNEDENENDNNNENDNENSNENSDEDENLNESEGQTEDVNGDDHRSAVANFVQGLLNVANREKGGIGEQVKAVAQAQNDAKEQESEAIDKINNRSKITTFLIGSDYKTLGQLRSQMVTTQNQIKQLNALLSKATDASTKDALTAQITALTLESQKINDFIKAQDSKFSLFGWLVKLFSGK